MAVAQGYGKIITSGSIFAYDTGDFRNSYIGEPTTNIFKHYGTTGQGSGANNNVSFDVNGTGTFIRLGYGQVFGGYTIQPNDVVYKYDLGSYGCHYHGNDVTISSGVYVTFTFDYYISPGAGGYPETNYLANMETSTGASTGIASPNNLTGIWQTISVTTGPTTSGGNLRPLLYPGGCGGRLASSGYILFKNPQVELLSHKTPFTQTTRSVTQGLLPIVGNQSLNLSGVSFDTNAQMTFDGTNDRFTTGLGNIGNNVSFAAVINSSGNATTYNMYMGQLLPYMGAYAGSQIIFSDYINSTQQTVNSPGGTIITGQNHYVVCTREYNGSNTTNKIYIDGKLSNSGTFSGAPTYYGDSIHIGDGQTSTWYPFYGKINAVQIYNRTLTAGEIEQNYRHYKTRFNLS